MTDPAAKSLTDDKHALLAAIVNSSEDAIISKTLSGTITSWNPAAQRLFGYSEEEALGKHISIIIPEERLPEENYIIGEISRGRRIEHFETVRRTKDGSRIQLSLSISPISTSDGTIIGASKIARDISERLAIQQERELLYRKTKILSKRKDEFIAMATHELKTPITSLKGFLEVLQLQTPETDTRYPLVNRCMKQVNKLTLLINDLLDVSRIQGGKLQLRPERFDMVSLAAEVLASYQHRSAHRLRLTAGAPVVVNADRLRLEQVFTNLIANAIKYAPGGGTVEVSISENRDTISVSVRDEGIGIDIENIADIFTPFYRAVDSRYRLPGLGMGLYISKEVIERHGGSITVKSKVGNGSVFTFTLPKQQKEN